MVECGSLENYFGAILQRGFESLSVRLVARSTTVVHPAVNGRVEGSNPSEPVPLWCNGSTGDFGSSSFGSNPSEGTYAVLAQR